MNIVSHSFYGRGIQEWLPCMVLIQEVIVKNLLKAGHSPPSQAHLLILEEEGLQVKIVVLNLVGSGTQVCISEHNFNGSTLCGSCDRNPVTHSVPNSTTHSPHPYPVTPYTHTVASHPTHPHSLHPVSLSFHSCPPSPPATMTLLQLIRCVSSLLSLDLCSASSLLLEHFPTSLCLAHSYLYPCPLPPTMGHATGRGCREALPSIPQSPFLRAASPGREGTGAALAE